MELLAALSKTEKQQSDLRFRPEGGRNAICLCSKLEDIYYAADLALIFSKYSDMQ